MRVSASRTLIELLWGWLHLAVLWTLAIAQPLLSILADEPAFFVARDNTNGDIVAVALILTLGPPTVLVAIEALVCRAYQAWDAVHLTFVAVLASVLVLQVVSDASGPSGLMIGLAALGGVLFALAYRTFDPVPSVLSVLAPVPFLVIAWFLFVSPVSDLLFQEQSAAASASASTARPLASAPPIVFVVFDEFFGGAIMDSRGHIDDSRYPNFAELAARSTWYRNASSVAGRTTEAVPAVMTGAYPAGDPLPTANEHPNSIFTMLADHYSMDVTETVTSVCPRAVCGEEANTESTGDRWGALLSDLSVVGLHTFLPERLRSRLPAVDRSFEQFRGQGRDPVDSGVTSAASTTSRKLNWERFVADLKPSAARPTLHFYHSILPHVPWQYLPSGKQYAVVGPDVPGLVQDAIWVNDPAVVSSSEQRFLLQLRFVDRQLGQLIRRLRATGLFDRALIVVTADHGVSFRPGQARRVLALDRPGDIASVPLFVKLPNQRIGRTDDSPVRTIDIVPTIADRLGIRPRGKVDGRSFLNGSPRSRNAPLRFIDSQPFTFTTLQTSRLRTTREMIALFGQRDGGAGIFAPKSSRSLLGREVESSALPSRPGASVQLDQASLLRNVNLRSSVLPAFISGSIAGARAHERIGVVVNSRINAITTTYSDAGAVRFAAMIPPDSLLQGSNSVEFVALEGSDESPVLVELGAAAEEGFALDERDGREVIVRSDGVETPVTPGAMQGFIDVLDVEASSIVGWAVDPEAKKPADRVVVFAGDRFLSSAPLERLREDLAQPIGTWAINAGFQVTIPAEDVEEQDVRIFAVSNGRASEL